MSAYGKDLDGTKYMSFLMKDDELLKNTMKFEKKVINGLKKEFDSQPIYNI